MRKKSILGIAIGIVVLLLGAAYLILSPQKTREQIRLAPEDKRLVALGQQVYVQNCASCHGNTLEGQPNWRTRMADGYLPAPPHDKNGHTWHHPDTYLFEITKYGIEKMIGKPYPNTMPIYENQLSDNEIVAVLSYIKSTWPERIQRQHDQINTRANAQRKAP